MKKSKVLLYLVIIVLICSTILILSACDFTRNDDNKNHNHTYVSEWLHDDINHWKVCDICGGKEQIESHAFDQKVIDSKYIVNESTCANKAIYFYSCICGLAGTKTFEHGELSEEHVWNDWHKVNNIIHDRECELCGKTETEEHTIYNAACIKCEYAEYEAKIVNFKDAEINQKTKTIELLLNKNINDVDLAEAMIISDFCNFKVYDTNNNEISNTINPKDGSNKYYIVVTNYINESFTTKYTLNIYKSFEVNLNYFDNLGNKIKTEIVDTGLEYTLSFVPNIDYYNFVEWTIDGNAETKVTPYADVDVVAKCTPIEYTITYIKNGGNLTTTKNSYNVESTITLDEPTRLGYTFAGWFENADFSGNQVTEIAKGTTGDKTFYAKWSPKPYNITYNLNGGELVTDKNTYNIETKVVLDTPTRNGYTFAGWFENADFSGNQATEIARGTTGDKTFYAKWSPKPYNITYNLNGGELVTDKNTYNIEASIILDFPTRNGCTFIGWYDNTDFNGQVITEISVGEYGDKTFYAKWNAIEYTITYILNGGELTTDKNTYNTETNIVLDNPARNDYTFAGWYGNKELIGNAITEITVGEYGNKIFYAKWDEGTEGLQYSLNSKGNYSVAGYNGQNTEVIIPELWKDIVVDTIATKAFINKTKLMCVIIGNNVTTIGVSAFHNCSNLTNITIPAGVTTISDSAFYSCSSLTNVIIPDNVTSIGASAFYNCSNLININIPAGVTTISDSVFYSCNSLTSLTIPDSVTNIGTSVFYNCSNLTNITIPAGVTTISDSAFYSCSSLTNVIIPDNVTSIGASAFYNCSNLININIPNRVTSIGSGAFKYCTSLTSVTISDSVTSIGWNAFEGCTGLTSIIIPDSVTVIGGKVLFGCNSLTSITVPFVGERKNGTTNTHFGYIFGATYFNHNYEYVPISLQEVIITGGKKINDSAFNGCKYLTKIIIPDSVTSIGSSAFSSCNRLTSITIPNSVEWIHYGALYGCSNLTSLTIPFVGENLNGTNKTHFGHIFGASSSDDNSTYVPTSLKEVIITGTNDIEALAFKNCDSIISIKISNGITHIGDYAFSECTSLMRLTIPDSITHIGDYAFSGCSKLQYKTFDNANYLGNDNNPYVVLKRASNESITSCNIYSKTKIVYMSAFYGCSSLTSITIPESVTNIGYYAFSGCSKLYSITLPFVGENLNGTNKTHFGYIFGASSSDDNSTYVPTSLKEVIILGGKIIDGFYKCSSITNITILGSVTSICDRAFRECTSLTSVTIPDSVTSIGSGAFSGCSILASVTIGKSVTSIGSGAFSGCSNLTSITIPDSVTKINDYAFSGCSILASVTIGKSVTSIGNSAFSGCTSLKSVIIPNGVTSIGGHAFSGCTSLKSVIIPDSVSTISDYAFYCCYIENATIPTLAISAIKNSKLKTITLTTGGTIDSHAFSRCSNLTSIIIGNGITSIGDFAFEYCTSLISVTIGDNITSIGSGAFYDCSSLTSITIPESVTDIDFSVFSGCTALSTMYIESEKVANYSDIGELLTYVTDVYIKADIELTANIYDNLYDNMGEVILDEIKYIYYKIKGENIPL